MIEFGLPALDREFKGISSTRIMAEGAPGCGKEVLAYHLINKVLERGEVCVVVTATQSHKDVQSALGYYRMRSAPIFWVETIEEFHGMDNVIDASIGELFTVSAAIKSVIEKYKGKKTTIIFDALSSALMCNDPRQVYDYCKGFVNLAKVEDITAYILLEREMHDIREVAGFEHLADVVLDFVVKQENGQTKRGVLIKKKAGRPTPEKVFEFTLSETGLEIKASPLK